MSRVGLVLGAGGVVGQAYHAGVLAALEHDLGWDPRSADVIVGSSAGSVTGSLLRLGVTASDLAAVAVEAPLSLAGAPLMARLTEEHGDFPPMDVRQWVRGWRAPPPRLLARMARRPWAVRPSVAAMTMLPAGVVDITERARLLDAEIGDQWPDGLWICAARRDDGRRVVFGRDGAPRARLADAVLASCAIPGYFSPITIDGVQYFDGGVHSPTNADVLRSLSLDLVIVVSPMSAVQGRSPTLDAPLRWSAHRRLVAELQRLRTGSTKVVTFEPGPRSFAAMGLNAMAIDRSAGVVQAAFLEAGRRAAKGRAAVRLAPITHRAARRRAVADTGQG